MFSFLIYYSIIRQPLLTYSESTGLFKETRICPLIEIVVNLVLSFVLIKYLDIFGILIGTLVAFLVSEFILKPIIIFKELYKTSSKKYYLQCLKLFIIFLLTSTLEYFIFININIAIENIFIWFLVFLIVFIINFIITLIIYV